MAYEKTTWANGDVITAEKLNKAEHGIADNVTADIVLHAYSHLDDEDNWHLDVDMTPAEFDAALAQFEHPTAILILNDDDAYTAILEYVNGAEFLRTRISPSDDVLDVAVMSVGRTTIDEVEVWYFSEEYGTISSFEPVE